MLELQKPLEEDTEKNQEGKEKEAAKIFRFAWLLFNVIFLFFLLKYSPITVGK